MKVFLEDGEFGHPDTGPYDRPWGPDPVAGPFLGPPAWHRVSELWLDPEPDADLAFEADVRLTDYLRKRKPLRR